MKLGKRFLALLLALTMILSNLPVSALAEEITDSTAETIAEISDETTQVPAEETEEVTEPTAETEAPTQTTEEAVQETSSPEPTAAVETEAPTEEPTEPEVTEEVLVEDEKTAAEEAKGDGEYRESPVDYAYIENYYCLVDQENSMKFYLKDGVDTTDLKYVFTLFYRAEGVYEFTQMGDPITTEELAFSIVPEQAGWYRLELEIQYGAVEIDWRAWEFKADTYVVNECYADPDQVMPNSDVTFVFEYEGELPEALTYEMFSYSNGKIVDTGSFANGMTWSTTEPGEYWCEVYSGEKNISTAYFEVLRRNVVIQNMDYDWNNGNPVVGEYVPINVRLNDDADLEGLDFVYTLYYYDYADYSYEQIGESVTLPTPEYSFLPERAGQYRVELVISDKDGELTSAYCNVYVEETVLTRINGKESYNVGDTITFTYNYKGQKPTDPIYYRIYTRQDYDIDWSNPVKEGYIDEEGLTFTAEKPGSYRIEVNGAYLDYVITRKGIAIEGVWQYDMNSTVNRLLTMHMELKPGANLSGVYFVYTAYCYEEGQWKVFDTSGQTTSKEYEFTPDRTGEWQVKAEVFDDEGLIASYTNDWLDVGTIWFNEVDSGKRTYTPGETVTITVDYEEVYGRKVQSATYEIYQHIYNEAEGYYTQGELLASGDIVNGKISFEPADYGEYYCSIMVTDQDGVTSNMGTSWEVSDYSFYVNYLASDGYPQMGKKVTIRPVMEGDVPSGVKYQYTLYYSADDEEFEIVKTSAASTKETYTFTPNKEGVWMVELAVLMDGEIVTRETWRNAVSKIKVSGIEQDRYEGEVGDTFNFKVTFTGGTPGDAYFEQFTYNPETGYYEPQGQIPIGEDGTVSITATEPGIYNLDVYIVTEKGLEVYGCWSVDYKVWEDGFAYAQLMTDKYTYKFGEPITVQLVGEDTSAVVSGMFTVYEMIHVGDGNYDYAGIAAEAPYGDGTFTFTPEATGVYSVHLEVTTESGLIWGFWDGVFDVDSHVHKAVKTKVEGQEATDEEPGWNDYYVYLCKTCEQRVTSKGVLMSDEQIAAEDMELIEKNLIYVKAQSVALTLDGEDVNGEVMLHDLENEENSYLLTAEILPVGAKQELKWTSSDEDVATVEAGVVTIVGPGTAKITAAAEDGSKKNASVTFQVFYRYNSDLGAEPGLTTELLEKPIGDGLQEGDQVYIYGTVVNAEGELVAVPAEELTFKIISGDKFATVDEEGLITATAPNGTVKVQAALKEDPQNRTASITIKTTVSKAASISLRPELETEGYLDEDGYIYRNGFVLGEDTNAWTLYVRSGDKQSFTMTTSGIVSDLIPEISVAGNVTWTTDNKSVATVKESKGVLDVTVAKGAAGEATITGTYKLDKTVTVTLKVVAVDYAPKLEGTSITLNTQKAEDSETLALTAHEIDQINTVYIQVYDKTEKDYIDTEAFDAKYADGAVTITALEAVDKGTLKAQLVVTTEHYTEYILPLSIKVVNQMPKITVKQTQKVNTSDLFGLITVDAGDEELESVTLEGCGYQIVDPEAEGGIYQVALMQDGDPTELSGTLQIKMKGYNAVAKTIKLSSDTKAVSVTLNTALEDICAYVDLPLGDLEANVAVEIYDKTAKAYVEDPSQLRATYENGKVRIEMVDETLKGTITARLVIWADDAHSGAINLKITVANKVPSITVKQVGKVNLKDDRSYALLTVTAKDAEVETVELVGGDFTVDGRDEDGNFRVYYIGEEAKVVTKTTVKATLAGYAAEPTKSLTVSTEKVDNKAILGATTLTLYETLPDMTATTTLSTYFKDVGVDSIKYPGGALILEYEPETGEITVSTPMGIMPKKGTYKFTITPYADNEALKAVTLTVKVAALPTVKLKPTTAKLKLSERDNVAEVAVTAAKAGNYDFSFQEIDHEEIDVQYNAETGKLEVALKEGCTTRGTRTITLTPMYGEVAAAQIKLKVSVIN